MSRGEAGGVKSDKTKDEANNKNESSTDLISEDFFRGPHPSLTIALHGSTEIN